jgi:hypothetical protein
MFIKRHCAVYLLLQVRQTVQLQANRIFSACTVLLRLPVFVHSSWQQ